ncbi:uncharacterized protein BJ171DRAFT_506973 [Polychytrium aggregatum]|uniref:uncharacterized protein n=1 Tax=Polychytrium aggregatum TaxID=110093 RepID=UPI0022FF2D77|nr:uncharacterized protein BJ171DRAFT_506973 [Polychytrium aggregatum]KAI9204315.1 hypothetical protein BJ171DRAFT_506973 [Polychytrium aggregatum]
MGAAGGGAGAAAAGGGGGGWAQRDSVLRVALKSSTPSMGARTMALEIGGTRWAIHRAICTLALEGRLERTGFLALSIGSSGSRCHSKSGWFDLCPDVQGCANRVARRERVWENCQGAIHRERAPANAVASLDFESAIPSEWSENVPEPGRVGRLRSKTGDSSERIRSDDERLGPGRRSIDAGAERGRLWASQT